MEIQVRVHSLLTLWFEQIKEMNLEIEKEKKNKQANISRKLKSKLKLSDT